MKRKTCNMFLENSSGFKIPAIGLGTWQATGDALEQALEHALSCGYRVFDTSLMYKNEAIIGSVIKKWIGSGEIRREDVCIITKLPNFVKNWEEAYKYFFAQLKSLQLDYIDIYMVHFPIGVIFKEFYKQQRVVTDPNTLLVDIWRKLEEVADAGKIKYLGLSNAKQEILERVLHFCRIKPVNVQIEFHPYHQQEDLVEFCHNNDITVTAFAPLGSPDYNTFLMDMHLPTKCLPPVLFDFKIRKIARKYKKTSAQMLLRYALQRGIGVIPKSVCKERIEENMNVFDFEIEEEDMIFMQRIRVPSVTSMSEHDLIPFPDELDSDLVPDEDDTSSERSNCSSSSDRTKADVLEEEEEEENHFELMLDVLHFNVADLSIELVMPDIIVVRGHSPFIQDIQGHIERGFEKRFKLPEGYNINRIVGRVSTDGVLTVTTESTPRDGESEVPVYCMDSPTNELPSLVSNLVI